MNRVTNRRDGLGQTKYTRAVLGNGQRTFRQDGPWTADEIIVTNRFGHDLDGNLTSDGRWTLYTWDGENRLIEMKRDTSTPTLSSRQRLVFEYDAQGRRIRKQFYTHNGTTWVEQRDTICLYDGWNVVAELDANASNAKLRTYVWGSDLSGSLEGAGGVGGLLWVNNAQTTYDGQSLPAGVHFVVDTARRIKEQGGIETVAIGTDFDGFTDPPDDVKDMSDLPNITEALLRGGFTEDEIQLILGGNALRVIRQGWGRH